MKRLSGQKLALLLAPAALLLFIYHPVIRGEVLASRDIFRLFIPKGTFLLECLRRGELPLWIPYERLGQPFLATLQTRVFSPTAMAPLLVFGPVRGPTIEVILLAAIAAWGCGRFARRLGSGRAGAVVSGCAFGLGPLVTQFSDQLHSVAALAWSGFIAEAAMRLGKKPSAGRAAALAAFITLSLLAGSPEMTLWQSCFAVVLAISSAPRQRRLAGTGAVLAAVAWGAMLAAANLLPALELASHSTRGESSAADQLEWSAPPVTLLASVWLNADLPRTAYWFAGDQGLIPSVFLGSVVVMLALGATTRRRLRPVVILAAAFALLSLGSHFPPSGVLLQVPPFSLFRYPVKYFLAFGFAMCALAGPGLSTWTALVRRGRPRRVCALSFLLAGVIVAAASGPITRLLEMRDGAHTGLVWSAGFIAAAALAAIVARPGSPQARMGLTAIALVELFAAQALIVRSIWVPASALATPSPYGQFLRDRGGRISTRADIGEKLVGRPLEQRIAGSRARLVNARFIEERLTAIEGYSALEPARITALTRNSPESLLASLGVRWVVTEPHLVKGATPAVSVPGLPNLYEIPEALPRVLVVHRAIVGSDEEARRALERDDLPIRTTAILADGAALDAVPPDGCISRARIVRERAGALEIAADACAEGYLVLMDTHFPGWVATVDGAPAALRRANVIGRAVPLPAGRHTVRFVYRPASFAAGAVISLLALALALLVVLRNYRSGSPSGRSADQRA